LARGERAGARRDAEAAVVLFERLGATSEVEALRSVADERGP
jgi:hypothetical protein